MSSPHTIDLLSWLNELNTTSPPTAQWHIHKAQLSHTLIQQNLPIKLIYHYEKLDDALKSRFPLKGSLLKQFNTPMTREAFVTLPELSGITLQEVAQPWQLKFSGKLVIFSQNPEVAIRLWFTNTLKDFELVYAKEINTAIEASFHHWQFVDSVEVICKAPDVILTAEHKNLPQPWQMSASPTFEPVPSAIALEIQTLLNTLPFVKEHWLPQLIDLAQGQIAILENE